MSCTSEPKIRSIVGLTHFRDLRSLRTGLMATVIGELGTPFPVRLYERSRKTAPWAMMESYSFAAQKDCIPSGDHRETDDLITADRRKVDIAILDQVSNSKVVIFDETVDGRPRTIFPIYAGNQLLSVLIIEVNLQLNEQAIIDTILQVYANLFFLLKNSIQDSLTGLLNRQIFDTNIQKMDNIISNTRRDGDDDVDCCLAFLDIDHFKRVNDKFGHLYGDEVLVLFANLMKEFFRDSDDKYRYGGEEFVVILKGVSLEVAIKLLDKFREKVASYLFPQVGQVTVSIGVTYADKSVPMVTVIERADKAVYHSKDQGRNRVTDWEALVNQTKGETQEVIKSDISLF